jgi:SAM-dependent methyltransferase
MELKEIKSGMEEIYREHKDPWRYEKISRHWLTLAIAQQFWPKEGGSLFEFPCGEGHLTEVLIRGLKPTPTEIFTLDISEVASQRARDRLSKICSEYKKLQYTHVLCDVREVVPVPKDIQLIVMSDILTFKENIRWSQPIVERVFHKLIKGGYLVQTEWAEEFPWTGFFTPKFQEGLNNNSIVMGLPPEGSEIVMTLRWTGKALSCFHEEPFETGAGYRVYKKTL